MLGGLTPCVEVFEKGGFGLGRSGIFLKEGGDGDGFARRRASSHQGISGEPVRRFALSGKICAINVKESLQRNGRRHNFQTSNRFLLLEGGPAFPSKAGPPSLFPLISPRGSRFLCRRGGCATATRLWPFWAGTVGSLRFTHGYCCGAAPRQGGWGDHLAKRVGFARKNRKDASSAGEPATPAARRRDKRPPRRKSPRRSPLAPPAA